VLRPDKGRACQMSRLDDETQPRQFDLDAPRVPPSHGRGLCVAVEKWNSRICDGQLSCLVLEPHATENDYVRIGTAHCPADWLAGVGRRSVRIV
jgi:hypothetical protein